jgi:hypothetical protein
MKKEPNLLLFEYHEGAAKEKNLGPPEAVACPTDEAGKMQDQLNGLYVFLRNSEFQLGLGAGVPWSPKLAQEFQTGLWADAAFSYKLSDVAALSLGLEGGELPSNNDSVTGGYRFSPGLLALTAKLRFAPKGFRPYVFAGPGMGLEHYSNSTTNGHFSQDSNYSDTGFGIVSGLGFEVQVDKIIYLYLQGEMVWSTTPGDLNRFIPMDNPASLVPVQAGIIFGR